MMHRALSSLLAVLLFVAIVAPGSAQQPAGDSGAPAPTEGPSLTIDSATVNGHQVQLHVNVQGASLAQAPNTGSDMSQMAGMDMSGMSMPTDQAMATGQGAHGGHLHVYVDGAMLVMVTQQDVTLTDVPSGTHEIRVELSDNLHQSYNPPVQATTSVVVP